MVKDLTNQGERYVLSSPTNMMTDTRDRDPISQALADVSTAYEDLFRDPTELPPKRNCDHAIHLKDNTTIPNIRPYRYPYYQKIEIEKFVQEMLVAGIIRPTPALIVVQ
ncbi:hypothetical protein V8G54_018487, partial [Vigna mungo]